MHMIAEDTQALRWSLLLPLVAAVIVNTIQPAGSEELSFPVRLSSLTIPGNTVIWNGLQFSNFTVEGSANAVTLNGSSERHLYGLSFAMDPGALSVSNAIARAEILVTYTVRSASANTSIGGVELTATGSSSGLGTATNAFTFYDASYSGIATSLGLAAVSNVGSSRDIENLVISTPILRVSGIFSASTFYASEHASMSGATHRFALSRDIPAGDFDLSGQVDGADFLLWQRTFGQNNSNPLALNSNLDADGNRDGRVDIADLTLWRSNFGARIGPPGDFDGDGKVDGADFLKWQRALGSNDVAVDASKNGFVDVADLLVWRDHFGIDGGSQSAVFNVPEPTSWLLAVVGIGGAWRVVRSRS